MSDRNETTQHQAEPELVSLIVRTKNRQDLLQAALASIACQSWRKIEMIVVNDGGTDVKPITSAYSNHQLKLIDLPQSRGRAGAANVGLQNAAGAWIGFLDDDDLLSPQHLEHLISAAAQQKSKVAYSGTRVVQVNLDGSQGEVAVYNYPYSPDRLLFENFIPIHSALFRRELVSTDVKFDEELEFFSDWDFWLQLSQKVDFLHVPRISATYRLHPRASGVHEQPNKTDAYLQIYRKWLSGAKSEQLISLLQKSHLWNEERVSMVQQVYARRLDSLGKQHSLAQRIVQERDQQLASLGEQHSYAQRIVEERDKQLASLGQQHSYAQQIVEERDKQLASLGELHSYAQSVVQKRDQQLASLGEQHSHAQRIVQERDQQLQDINQAHQRTLAELTKAQEKLARIRSSFLGRIADVLTRSSKH